MKRLATAALLTLGLGIVGCDNKPAPPPGGGTPLPPAIKMGPTTDETQAKPAEATKPAEEAKPAEPAATPEAKPAEPAATPAEPATTPEATPEKKAGE